MDVDEQLLALVAELRQLGRECEWVEFKHNNAKPDEVGEYISALSNAARLHGRDCGYLVWGIEDGSVDVVGTQFDPWQAKVGSEDLRAWLTRSTNPRLHLRWRSAAIDGCAVVVLEVPAAVGAPTAFKTTRFIRVGSYKHKLFEHQGKERELWKLLEQEPFERGVARSGLSASDVADMLDYRSYFNLVGQSLPDSYEKSAEQLSKERLVRRDDDGSYSVTNLGALLLADRLERFDGLQRRAVRVIVYEGEDRTRTLKEKEGVKGYAAGFEGLIEYINDQLPHNEVLGEALRRTVKMYPEEAVREIVANALIHQDLTCSGSGPMVEVFSDRIEITNPGAPLIDANRFIDHPPQSRNDRMASFMRRVNICEERGSGVDKAIFAVEVAQLPPPDFVVREGFTKVVLFALRPFARMTAEERVRACYQHACLQEVSNRKMNNESLRNRFGIEPKNRSMASRVIRDTLERGLIKDGNPANASTRLAVYEPFWA